MQVSPCGWTGWDSWGALLVVMGWVDCLGCWTGMMDSCPVCTGAPRLLSWLPAQAGLPLFVFSGKSVSFSPKNAFFWHSSGF